MKCYKSSLNEKPGFHPIDQIRVFHSIEIESGIKFFDKIMTKSIKSDIVL